jgi:hypothetical protein
MSGDKKRKRTPIDPSSHVPIKPPTLKRVHHTITTDVGSSSYTHVLARIAVPKPPLPILTEDSGERHTQRMQADRDEEEEVDVGSGQKRTQVRVGSHIGLGPS